MTDEEIRTRAEKQKRIAEEKAKREKELEEAKKEYEIKRIEWLKESAVNIKDKNEKEVKEGF